MWVCEVCSSRMRGAKPSCIACCVSEYAPEISAWDATIAADVAITTIGINAHVGASRKNGFTTAGGVVEQQAPPGRGS